MAAVAGVGIVSWQASRLKGSTPTGRFAASMSALGQKRTYGAQKRMSALPPISTAKANMKFSNRKFRRSGRGDTLVCGRSGFFGHETGAKALQLLTLPVP